MTTVSSAGVLGLVAIPPASRSTLGHDAPQVSANLLSEASLCSPLGVEAQRTAIRAASFVVTAAALSCLFVGVALAIEAASGGYGIGLVIVTVLANGPGLVFFILATLSATTAMHLRP